MAQTMSSPAVVNGGPATPAPAPAPKSAPKQKRPNYNLIHADALPIALHHAPPLIPHNPLSLLHHLYLYLFPPRESHRIAYKGVFSPATLSVEVTDPESVLGLWNRGFWGKGSLSRSEPTWLHRELRRLGDTQVGETAEEITRKRRDQRKEMKKERARKEKEELAKVKAAEEGAAKGGGLVVNLEDEINGLESKSAAPLHPSQPAEATNSSAHIIENGGVESTTEVVATNSTPAILPVSIPPTTSSTNSSLEAGAAEAPAIVVQNQEHLQLMLSEAFFLSYALGILSITTSPTSITPIPTKDLLHLFLRHQTFPPLPASKVSLTNIDPCNEFLLNYVVYHYFRSLGWVVKSGVKFSVDYLLYKRGPVFSHAEFAVLILPSYSRWSAEEYPEQKLEKEWHWLHSITRVNSQVKKTVLLVYVDIPTPDAVAGWDAEGKGGIKALLGHYRVREVALRRWISGRNRD